MRDTARAAGSVSHTNVTARASGQKRSRSEREGSLPSDTQRQGQGSRRVSGDGRPTAQDGVPVDWYLIGGGEQGSEPAQVVEEGGHGVGDGEGGKPGVAAVDGRAEDLQKTWSLPRKTPVGGVPTSPSRQMTRTAARNERPAGPAGRTGDRRRLHLRRVLGLPAEPIVPVDPAVLRSWFTPNGDET